MLPHLGKRIDLLFHLKFTFVDPLLSLLFLLLGFFINGEFLFSFDFASFSLAG